MQLAIDAVDVFEGAVIVAAAGGVVAVARRGLISSGRKLSKITRRLVTADHRTIAGGWSNREPSGGSQFRVAVKFAPSVEFGSPHPADEATVHDWARRVLGSDALVDYCVPSEQIRYVRNSRAGEESAFALAWPSGLLELIVPISHGLDSSGSPTIDVLEIAHVLASFHASLTGDTYRSMFGRDRLTRHRFDWRILISSAIGTPTYTPVSALAFPGRKPRARAASSPAPMSNDGFGNSQLLDIRDDVAPTVIILNVLADYIQRAGYIDAEDCLADIETEVTGMCRALQP